MTVPTAESREQQVLQGLLLGCVATIPLSIALAEALAYVALAWAMAGLRHREENWRRCPLFWPVVIFVVVAVFSSLWGFRPVVALARTHNAHKIQRFRSSNTSGWLASTARSG